MEGLVKLGLASALLLLLAHVVPVQASQRQQSVLLQAQQPMLFADEFDGTSLDTSAWVAMNRPGDASNNEVECYRPSNVAVANGLLTFTSQVDSSCAGYSYTS